ncbi:aspartate/methionine/tyrosine aminotransferase [Lachnotalea glycerini]|uniref:Aminotransferase n=1 Tax=Lachnotalea glycerini TaxID=1763509 RepID=A0A255ITC1_9FIRM|nr:pyridoxal phosphate-dependent aminotransferase [Lachnotalea glycerini]PXV89117.1 aspartate/methionine/tyrosine aminotransferase [Lachnotalea glycerini]RDY30493.1 pyridoxal phosphate-dependent aminotransferase [Lachnotalea glycerini]
MVPERYKEMLGKKSVIREMFAYGAKRAEEIGYDHVFDYSLGNPSVPAPKDFQERLLELVQSEEPTKLHGYSPSLGIESTKNAVAKSLNQRFDMSYQSKHIFMVSGAAGAIAHAVRAVTNGGDEVITFAPFFPEYIPYINSTGALLQIVPADINTFSINFDKLLEFFNPKVTAVLINTPNNPSGVVYSTQTLTKLSQILSEKEKEYGHPIYLISDEPYREIVFNGVDAPYVAKLYHNSLTCYSFSKSLSIPGERIGYIAVNPQCEDADILVDVFGQISRGIGHNCPPSLMQLAIETVLDKTSDLSVYEKNKEILYEELKKLGFECVEPGGTFYMFPRALEEDANRFCERAKEFDLLLVPGDSFGCKGHFRISYCVDTPKVIRSLEAFHKLAKIYK